MLISYVVAPEIVAQVYKPQPHVPPAPQLDHIDNDIVAVVREHGPVKIWTLLNRLAEAEGAGRRTEGRIARLNLLGRVRRLKRLEQIFGVGRNELVAVKPSLQSTRPRPRRQRVSVSKSSVLSAVSGVSPAALAQQPEIHYVVASKLVSSSEPPARASTGSLKSESAITTAQASETARLLALLPRRARRRWSGMIGSARSFKNMRIKLPDGRVVYALGAKRGRVIYTSQPDGQIGSVDGLERDWGMALAGQVQVIKNPLAQILGSRKRGVKEVPSAAKVAACRVNGCRPVRPGRRPRGRPRRSALGNGQHVNCAVR